MITAPSVTHDIVHRRTGKGQRAIQAGVSRWAPAEAKLLRMVNGFTPSSYLSGLAAIPPEEAARAIGELERQGYIEKAQRPL